MDGDPNCIEWRSTKRLRTTCVDVCHVSPLLLENGQTDLLIRHQVNEEAMSSRLEFGKRLGQAAILNLCPMPSAKLHSGIECPQFIELTVR